MADSSSAEAPQLDDVIRGALTDFASTSLHREWYGKEHSWVSLFAFSHLVKACREGTPLFDPGQIAIDAGVPQPPGYTKSATRRDIVIWPQPGGSCWNLEGVACHHPLAILEWKVHRRGYRNREVAKERKWLVEYTRWQPRVLAYAIAIESGRLPVGMSASQYSGGTEISINPLSGGGRQP